ncbi:hypothetical protein FJ251_04150 [bacterium]|nr:hypothetical protein [bacterium]
MDTRSQENHEQAEGDRLRAVIYSHDTYGLGHLTRTQRVAAGIVAAFPQACVLIVSGSPVAHRFQFPARVDYLKLPSVVKLGPSEYGSRSLLITPRRIRRLRSRLILTAIDHFRPNLLMVDNVPLGMKGELRPALQHLKRRYPNCKIHLNLRDILDDASTIRAHWQATGAAAAVEGLFDAVNVFGCREIYDSEAAYALPSGRTRFLGYIGPGDPAPTAAPGTPPGARARVLVTVGGGGDGEPLLSAVADLQAALGPASPYHFLVITGPLMDGDTRTALGDRFAQLPAAECHEYLPDLPAQMAAADLVLSMGGYNTLCEVMARARRAIVVPRQHPRREQLIRAEALAARGVLRLLALDRLDTTSLQAALASSLDEGPTLTAAVLPALDGIAVLQRQLREDFRASVARPRGGAAAAPPGAERGASAPPLVGALPTPPRGAVSAPRAPLKHLLTLACLLLAGARSVSAGLQPAEAALGIRLGHDSNLLDASDAERAAFAAGAPGTLFAVDAMTDRFLDLAAQARWTLGRPLGVKTQLAGDYERRQYIGNAIVSRERFGIELLGRLAGRTRVGLKLGYVPQVYARHRLDKDALPGAPLFRAEVYSAWETGLELRQALGERWQLSGEVGGTWRDYVEAFNERDRRRLALALGANWEANPRLRLALSGGHLRSWSRNEPDLGRDLSAAEWWLRPALVIAAAPHLLEAELALELRRREYLSTLVDDWSHYGREDRSGAVQATLQRTLRADLALVGQFTRAWRSAELAAESAIDYDDEGTFSESVVAVGIDWRWED